MNSMTFIYIFGCAFFLVLIVLSVYIIKHQDSVHLENHEYRRVEQTFVINLPDRTEKWKQIQKTMRSIPNLTRRDGVIADPPAHLGIKKGTYGCAMAHLKVLEEISGLPSKEDDDELWYLILEDDAQPIGSEETFYDDITSSIKSLPRNADSIDMGLVIDMGFYPMLIFSPLGDRNVYKGFMVGLNCYAVTPSSAKKFIDVVKRNGPTDHIDQIFKRYTRTIKTSYFKYLCTQNKNYPSDRLIISGEIAK